MFGSAFCYVYFLIVPYFLSFNLIVISVGVFVLQLYTLALSLGRFIHASRDLYKRRHIMERLDLLKNCFSDCALFFGVLIAIAIMSTLHIPLLMVMVYKIS